MTKLSAGAAVVEILKQSNVETVFGLLGGSMLPIYDALYDCSRIRYIGARDERSATHMADAYARVNNTIGVVLAGQAGPGVTNLVTGITQAHLAYSPVLAIAGMINRDHQGRDTFQEIDQVALFKPICKGSIIVPKATRLPELLIDAIRLTMSNRKGPVVLHLPHDVCGELIEYKKPLMPLIVEKASINDSQIKQILNLLMQSQSPIIFAGSAFKSQQASQSLKLLAEILNIPVVASTGHADIMPHGHPLFAGQTGPRGNMLAAQLTREADLILALGNRMAFNSTFHSHEYINADAKIVQIDIDDRFIGRYFPVEIGIQADVVNSVNLLSEYLETNEFNPSHYSTWLNLFNERIINLQDQRADEAALDHTPLHPHRALAEIRNTLPENAIVTLDTGNACLQAADRLAHYQAPGLITSLDFGLVGFGYAAALGAKAAQPNRVVIAVIGDGGFGFTLGEVNTAVQYNLAVIAVVLDNGAWGAEKAYQSEFFGKRFLGADIVSPSYDNYATLCGAIGYKVNHPGELEEALKMAIKDNKPAIIHVKIDAKQINALRKDLFKAD